MGGTTSTYSFQASDLFNISSNTHSKCGNHFEVRNGSVTFSSEPCTGTKSTVANASGQRLRMFYHKEKLKLEDLLDSETSNKTFKPKAELPFIDLLPNLHLEVPSVEEGFASVLVTNLQNGEVYIETIAQNFKVPHGACCIVTENNEIKFRKPNGGVWIDVDDCNHGHQRDPESGSSVE